MRSRTACSITPLHYTRRRAQSQEKRARLRFPNSFPYNLLRNRTAAPPAAQSRSFHCLMDSRQAYGAELTFSGSS